MYNKMTCNKLTCMSESRVHHTSYVMIYGNGGIAKNKTSYVGEVEYWSGLVLRRELGAYWRALIKGVSHAVKENVGAKTSMQVTRGMSH